MYKIFFFFSHIHSYIQIHIRVLLFAGYDIHYYENKTCQFFCDFFLVYPTSMPLPVSHGESTTSATPVTLQSPMANLMSITETLPPGSPRSGPSPPGPPPPRTASRSSQHSPNSSGKWDSCFFFNVSENTTFWLQKKTIPFIITFRFI